MYGKVLISRKYFGEILKHGDEIPGEQLESLAPYILKAWVSQGLIEIIHADDISEYVEKLEQRIEELEKAVFETADTGDN